MVIETGAKITAIDDKGKAGVVLTTADGSRTFEKVLVSIGREPVTDDIGLNTVGITTENRFNGSAPEAAIERRTRLCVRRVIARYQRAGHAKMSAHGSLSPTGAHDPGKGDRGLTDFARVDGVEWVVVLANVQIRCLESADFVIYFS